MLHPPSYSRMADPSPPVLSPPQPGGDDACTVTAEHMAHILATETGWRSSARHCLMAPHSARVLAAIDTIAAVVHFNRVSLEESYEAFDTDEDERLSLLDLQTAVHMLGIDIHDDTVRDLYAALDPAGLGYIPGDVWSDMIRAAGDGTVVLRARGIHSYLPHPSERPQQAAMESLIAALRAGRLRQLPAPCTGELVALKQASSS